MTIPLQSTGHETLSQADLDSKFQSALEGLDAPVIQPAPAPTPEKVEIPAPAPVTDTPAPSPAPTIEPTPEPTELFAGRYKTEDDLEKGVGELAGKLDQPTYFLKKEIAEARKSGDWAGVEELYKELQAIDTRRNQADHARQGQVDAERERLRSEQDVQVSETERVEAVKKWNDFTAREYGRQIKEHPIQQQFTERGMPFPETKEDVENLRLTDPVLFFELREATKELLAGIDDFRVRYFDAKAKQPELLQSARGEAEKAIKAKNDRLKLGLTDVQIQADLDGIFKLQDNPFIYEEKDGVPTPRANGAAKYWNAEMLDQYLEKAVVDAENRGALRQADDLRKMRAGEIAAPSTSHIPGAAGRSASRKPNLRSEADVRGMSDKDLAEAFDKKLAESLRPD